MPPLIVLSVQHDHGFCYVTNTPITPSATKALLERIAFIRPTHYGGFYDFTSDLSLKDTAYTTLSLGAHTDTTYFSDPAGLQMFHLLSHTDGKGGASLLVDGFKAAEVLRAEDARAWETLQRVQLRWHASGNDGISLQPWRKFAVLETVGGELQRVRWNNDDRATMDLDMRGEEIREWYRAARKWNDVLGRKEMQYWEQLRPGRPVGK